MVKKIKNSQIEYVINELNKYDCLRDVDSKLILENEVGFAHIIAKYPKDPKKPRKEDINTSQLRKFFGEIKKIETKESWKKMETDFYLLKPRMAVAVGRKNIPEPFYRVMMVIMSKVDNGDTEEVKKENFEKFVKLFEAIVAYRKYEYPNSG